MFILKMQSLLNDRCELDPVCRAAAREDLERLVRESACEPYEDPIPVDWKGPPFADGVTTIRKFFKKGSRLEWCDLPGAKDRHIVPAATEDEWVAESRQQWREQIGRLSDVSVAQPAAPAQELEGAAIRVGGAIVALPSKLKPARIAE